MSKTLGSFCPKPIVLSSTGWKKVGVETPNKEFVVARAGTPIVCPKCGVQVGRLFSDLYSGVSCRADQVEFAPGQQRQPHEPAACKKCGEGYMKMHRSYRNGTCILLSVELNGRRQWI